MYDGKIKHKQIEKSITNRLKDQKQTARKIKHKQQERSKQTARKIKNKQLERSKTNRQSY